MLTLCLNDNSEDYRLANRVKLSAWVARKFSNSISLSTRLEANFWDDIDGADDRLNPGMGPTADPKKRSGSRLDAYIGLNYKLVF